MLIFSLRYPRNKLQITFLSALVCPDTRLQPLTPQPAINSQSLLHYVAWWGEGPKPDKSTPKTISTTCDKMVFPNKNHFTKAGKFRYQKMLESYKNEGISTISPIKRTLEKHRDTYKSWFFLAVLVKNHSFSFRSSVWLPHDLTAIPLPCCLTTLHTLV